MKAITSFLMFAIYITGIVLAKGWLTLLAILIPPYSWYIAIEFALKHYGIL